LLKRRRRPSPSSPSLRVTCSTQSSPRMVPDWPGPLGAISCAQPDNGNKAASTRQSGDNIHRSARYTKHPDRRLNDSSPAVACGLRPKSAGARRAVSGVPTVPAFRQGSTRIPIETEGRYGWAPDSRRSCGSPARCSRPQATPGRFGPHGPRASGRPGRGHGSGVLSRLQPTSPSIVPRPGRMCATPASWTASPSELQRRACASP
jgi:hypothetical protein